MKNLARRVAHKHLMRIGALPKGAIPLPVIAITSGYGDPPRQMRQPVYIIPEGFNGPGVYIGGRIRYWEPAVDFIQGYDDVMPIESQVGYDLLNANVVRAAVREYLKANPEGVALPPLSTADIIRYTGTLDREFRGRPDKYVTNALKRMLMTGAVPFVGRLFGEDTGVAFWNTVASARPSTEQSSAVDPNDATSLYNVSSQLTSALSDFTQSWKRGVSDQQDQKRLRKFLIAASPHVHVLFEENAADKYDVAVYRLRP